MTVGEMIVEARERRGMKQAELANLVGVGTSTLSGYESNSPKRGVDPEVLVRISEALEEPSILTTYLQGNPAYRAVLPKIFPELNNIRRDPAIIFTRLAKELQEAAEASLILAELFSNADPRRVASFDQIFKAQMEQVIDPKRGIEILEFQLLASGVMSKQLHKEIYDNQQRKCIGKGHHVPDEAA